MSEENKFTEDLIEQIAGFFATKIGNPRLAYELVGCSGSTCGDGSSCCCSCASPSDQSDSGGGE